jgi:hypothetical protein
MLSRPAAGTLATMNPQPRVIAIIAAAGLALLAAACGSNSSSTASTGSTAGAGTAASASTGAAFTQCMHSHGIPDYPAPQSNGQLQKIVSGQQVGVSDATLQSASTACQSLWPYQALTPAQQQQELAQDLKFAQCMRAQGLPKFPDPTATQGRVVFVINASQDGFDPHSAQVLAKARHCEDVLPKGSGLPSVQVTS